MTDRSPHWPEVFARTQAAGFRTAAGVIRYRLSGGEHGEVRFWHRVPDHWRVEDEGGVWHIADGRRQLLRTDGRLEDFSGAGVHFGQRHPRTLFGVRRDQGVQFDWMREVPVPDGDGELVEIAGRSAWEFALRVNGRERKPFPLRVAVDQTTGTVLRLAIPEVGHVIELTEFTVDGELPEGVFTWDGPVSTRHHEESARSERAHRWLAETALPMPRWWPRGLGYHAGDGDPATGAYRVHLEVPDFPELCRWPAGTPMPPDWDERHLQGGQHVHRWSDERWEWALAVRQPLSDEDLARVIESIPAG